MKHLTLYDIMGSDHYVISDIKNGEVQVMVIDEDDSIVFNETSHRFAWDSLVAFSKMVLDQDEKIKALIND